MLAPLYWLALYILAVPSAKLHISKRREHLMQVQVHNAMCTRRHGVPFSRVLYPRPDRALSRNYMGIVRSTLLSAGYTNIPVLEDAEAQKQRMHSRQESRAISYGIFFSFLRFVVKRLAARNILLLVLNAGS